MVQMSRINKCFVLCVACMLLSFVGSSEAVLASQADKTRAERSEVASKAVKVATGLTIQHVADDDLAPDCTAMATDSDGRLLVSGPGYVRELLDRDGDGIYDAFRSIADSPSHGAHGLCVDGDALYYVGDNGVWQINDFTSGDEAESKPVRVLEIKTGGEHDAHALRKGPDGFWYLIAGNGTKGSFELQNAKSPLIPHPRAGVIWCISPDWTQREVWADGFRNAYDFDFGPDQTIDTFDSDGERDVSLPWYRPTRVFRVRRGQDAGWVSRSWKRPNADPLMPGRACRTRAWVADRRFCEAQECDCLHDSEMVCMYLIGLLVELSLLPMMAVRSWLHLHWEARALLSLISLLCQMEHCSSVLVGDGVAAGSTKLMPYGPIHHRTLKS